MRLQYMLITGAQTVQYFVSYLYSPLARVLTLLQVPTLVGACEYTECPISTDQMLMGVKWAGLASLVNVSTPLLIISTADLVLDHTIPLYACAFVCILLFSFLSDHYQNKPFFITLTAGLGTVFFVSLQS